PTAATAKDTRDIVGRAARGGQADDAANRASLGDRPRRSWAGPALGAASSQSTTPGVAETGRPVSKHISEGTLGCFSIKRQLLLRSKIALAFLTVFPTPQAAAQLN